MQDIKDILIGLDVDINLNNTRKDIKVSNKKENNTNEIKYLKKKTINIVGKKRKKKLVLKNKTRNFDSIVKNKKLKNINLVKIKKENIDNQWKTINLTKNKQKKKKIKKKNFNIKKYKNIFWFRKKIFLYFLYCFIVLWLFYWISWYYLQKYINSWYNKMLKLSTINIKETDVTQQLIGIHNDFEKANKLIKPFLIIPNENIKNIFYVIKWWYHLSSFLNDSYSYYNNLNNNLQTSWIDNINFLNLLNNWEYIYNNFSKDLEAIIFYYDKVWYLFNKETTQKFEKARFLLNEFHEILTLVNRNFNTLKNIFWANSQRKYLVLLQNNDEIRPTWGFMWSIWAVVIKKWEVIDFQMDDIYAYEWEIDKNYTEKILAPEGINKVTEYFWIRDANNKITFNDSSKQIKYFLDYFFTDIDGLIYINQSTILELLDVLWWVYFEKLDTNVNSSNFSAIMSSLVEAKAFKVWTLWTPKQVLFDFSEDFVKTIKEKGLYSKYWEVIFNDILTRDIVFNSFIWEENSLAWKLWIDWSISYYDSLDFNYPVFTSIWWWKTDRYMIRDFEKDVIINDDCSINTSFTITQKHYFTKEDEVALEEILNSFEIYNQELIHIQGKTDNKQFVQVILPKDAIILNPEKYIITENSNNKVVKFYTTVERFQSLESIIEYSLENKECKDYNYILYKQAGLRDYDVNFMKDDMKIEAKWVDKDFVW